MLQNSFVAADSNVLASLDTNIGDHTVLRNQSVSSSTVGDEWGTINSKAKLLAECTRWIGSKLDNALGVAQGLTPSRLDEWIIGGEDYDLVGTLLLQFLGVLDKRWNMSFGTGWSECARSSHNHQCLAWSQFGQIQLLWQGN
ncbi:hypothetical protein OGATHE_000889 [Ogataea polymorpha]|uniref:Uncharacterized protein n=1 Tax=Ogataea polymorpha TaxID=460523 RepID=A0A9P8PTP2_9ASCO|nr:hypothetical protein OGATHE_000889 [Ogataea polymorpha]